MNETKKAAKAPAARNEAPEKWTDDERAAMKERAKELKAAGRRRSGAKVDGEADVLAKIAEMPTADRVMAERIHALVKEHAPTLTTRTWYGMPAYYKDGKVLCFFQSSDKFKARYATFGFDESAKLDDGAMWPTAFAVMELTPAVEARIVALVKQAVG
ncbi:MAG: iron chaperone [Candidatus Limnocylindrales bacterium]